MKMIDVLKSCNAQSVTVTRLIGDTRYTTHGILQVSKYGIGFCDIYVKNADDYIAIYIADIHHISIVELNGPDASVSIVIRLNDK